MPEFRTKPALYDLFLPHIFLRLLCEPGDGKDEPSISADHFRLQQKTRFFQFRIVHGKVHGKDHGKVRFVPQFLAGCFCSRRRTTCSMQGARYPGFPFERCPKPSRIQLFRPCRAPDCHQGTAILILTEIPCQRGCSDQGNQTILVWWPHLEREFPDEPNQTKIRIADQVTLGLTIRFLSMYISLCIDN